MFSKGKSSSCCSNEDYTIKITCRNCKKIIKDKIKLIRISSHIISIIINLVLVSLFLSTILNVDLYIFSKMPGSVLNLKYYSNYSIYESFILYLSSIIIYFMIGLPFILIVYSIANMKYSNHQVRYKPWFIINFTLSIVLVIIIGTIGYKPEIFLKLYVICSCLGFLICCFIEFILFHNNLNSRLVILKTISSFVLVVLIFLTTSGIGKLEREENNLFDDFIIQDHIADSVISDNLINYVENSNNFIERNDTNSWKKYITLLMPLLMLAVTGFLIISLYHETSIENKKKRPPFIWMAFILELIIFLIFYVSIDYFNEINYQKMTISPELILLTSITLALAIFKTFLYEKISLKII